MRNPFLYGGLLNQSLAHEHCQRILFTALRRARRHSLMAPGRLGSVLDELRVLEHYAGPSVYLLHPGEVATLFHGLTLSAYQSIQNLYVDRLGRSLVVITRILAVMAAQAGAAPLADEAIWAVGIYLNERRSEEIAVDLAPAPNLWVLTSIRFKMRIVQGDGRDEPSIIVVVVDNTHGHVLAWRLANPESEQIARALAIYDALVLQRAPAQLAPTGLRWTTPKRLGVVGALPPGLDVLGRELDITVEVMDVQPPLVSQIEAVWEYAKTTFTEQQFRLTFDTYLHRQHGFGPQRAKRDRAREFAGLIGYNRDPAWQLPVLQTLLVEHEAVIDSQGEVELAGLHFQNELLALFPNTPVTLRLSEHSEATAWIYLDGEILCEANARELRRADGTYRTRLPKGRSRLAD
jgi:hypothetical protein